jgi:hypothetical protein
MPVSPMDPPLAAALAGDEATIEAVAREALGGPRAAVGPWRLERTGAPNGPATGGVYRLSGQGRDPAGAARSWSVILKTLQPIAPAFDEESHPLYWQREARVYESGLLDALPAGVRAPRCYAVTRPAPALIRLWLEEARDATPAWGPAQYARAARALGRFNGAFAAGRGRPAAPWLVRDGSPRGLLEYRQPWRDRMADPALWDAPLLRAVFPTPIAGRLLRLWDEREPLLRALDAAPHSFCHLDAWRRNMFLPAAAPGFTLIDWAFPGQAALGTDAADLFGASFSLAETGATPPAAFDATIFGAYVAGLRDAGWRGAEGAVRGVYAAVAALKYGCCLLWLGDLADPAGQARWERVFGRAFPAFARRQAALVAYLLDLADEARAALH